MHSQLRHSLLHYAGAGVALAFLANLLVRLGLKLGGLPATLLAATLVAVLLPLLFRWREQRLPALRERLLLTWHYAWLLGLLYLGLLGMMYLKDEPGWQGQLLFALHYFCYPALLWLLGSPRLRGRRRS